MFSCVLYSFLLTVAASCRWSWRSAESADSPVFSSETRAKSRIVGSSWLDIVDGVTKRASNMRSKTHCARLRTCKVISRISMARHGRIHARCRRTSTGLGGSGGMNGPEGRRLPPEAAVPLAVVISAGPPAPVAASGRSKQIPAKRLSCSRSSRRTFCSESRVSRSITFRICCICCSVQAWPSSNRHCGRQRAACCLEEIQIIRKMVSVKLNSELFSSYVPHTLCLVLYIWSNVNYLLPLFNVFSINNRFWCTQTESKETLVNFYFTNHSQKISTGSSRRWAHSLPLIHFIHLATTLYVLALYF